MPDPEELRARQSIQIVLVQTGRIRPISDGLRKGCLDRMHIVSVA
jgi:hypothetical protein